MVHSIVEQATPEEQARHLAYLRAEGLDALLDGGAAGGFPPDVADLVRLHKAVRSRLCFTVLEFGVGWSTLVLADALQKNERQWESLPMRPVVRNRFLFRLFSVDASESWIAAADARLPAGLRPRVELRYSPVRIGCHEGQVCHYYERLPDIVPDFIYLDGPDPRDVHGDINGLSFRCEERTVMSADLLAMEPTLLPGAFVLVDGRTNNARFLERNLKRKWDVAWDRAGDVTTFELNEERLGRHNLLGSDFFRAPR